jgi:hypothetical protein
MSKTKTYLELIEQCREIIEFDTARIDQPSENTLFLIVGFNRNTKDNEGQWLKDGEPYDFDYVEEQVIAAGKTEEELLASVREYKRLCGMTMEDYLNEHFDIVRANQKQ